MTKDNALISTEDRLRRRRRIAEDAQRLSEAIEQQASNAQALAVDSDRLIGEAQATLNRAEILMGDHDAQIQATKLDPH